MTDWVIKARSDVDRKPPIESVGADWVKRQQARVERAEALRPSTLLGSKVHALLNAENRVITARNRDEVAASLQALVGALVESGQDKTQALTLTNTWYEAHREVVSASQAWQKARGRS